MKKFASLILCIGLAMFAISCDDDEDVIVTPDTPETPDEPTPDPTVGGLAVPANVYFDTSSSTDISLLLWWSLVTDADTYTVRYWAEGEDDDPYTLRGISTNRYTITDLEPSTTYYAQVKAISSDDESEWSDVASAMTKGETKVYVSAITVGDNSNMASATTPTTVTARWWVDDFTSEENAAQYAYDFGIYKDEACTDLVVQWSSDAAVGTGGLSSIWQPGNTARVWFTFSDLEPSTDYWVRVNITGNENSTSDPCKFTTEPAFSTTVTATGEGSAQVNDVILVQDFDKLIHGGDPVHRAAGVLPTWGDDRKTVKHYSGINPEHIFTTWHWQYEESAMSPFPVVGGAWSSEGAKNGENSVGESYTEGVGLVGWICGTSSSGNNLSNAPGYIRIGNSGFLGYLATPVLSAIPEGKSATVRVDFDATPYLYDNYYAENLVVAVIDNDEIEVDGYTQQVEDWGSSNYSSTGVASEVTVPLDQNSNAFVSYGTTRLSGVTNNSRIRFSSYSTKSQFMLDNIVITIESMQ